MIMLSLQFHDFKSKTLSRKSPGLYQVEEQQYNIVKWTASLSETNSIDAVQENQLQIFLYLI